MGLFAFLITICGCMNPAVKAGANALGQGRYDQAIQHFETVHKDPENKIDIATSLATAHRAKAADLVGQGHCVRAADRGPSAATMTDCVGGVGADLPRYRDTLGSLRNRASSTFINAE